MMAQQQLRKIPIFPPSPPPSLSHSPFRQNTITVDVTVNPHRHRHRHHVRPIVCIGFQTFASSHIRCLHPDLFIFAISHFIKF